MQKYKRKAKYSIKTIITVIIITIAGFIVPSLKDTINDNLAAGANKIKIKHINSIHDGDTINVTTYNNKKVKIRLFGIDAPELKQPFGEKSRICLENMIKDKKISYIPRNKSKPNDKYGRVVGIIFHNDININIEMVKQGCAWNYWDYNKSLYTLFSQIYAKNKKLGLWADDNPQAPWEYRHNRK